MKRRNTVLGLMTVLVRSACARGWARIGAVRATLGGVVVALALWTLALVSIGSTAPIAVYDRSVEEVLASPREYSGRRIRVRGHVCDVIEHDVVAQVHEFRLTSGEDPLRVRYEGILPDTMLADWDLEVVVEGELQPSGVFAATQVIARCPSKYDARGPGPRWRCPGPAGR